MSQREDGFTLIELLTVIAIVGILSALGLTSFGYYKASAAYASVEATLHDARNALEAGTVDADNLPASVPLVLQGAQGPITDNLAADLLPGMMLPRNTAFRVSYDSSCDNGGCQSTFLQVNHCFGDEYAQFIRFGDGVELKLDHIAGEGCPE